MHIAYITHEYPPDTGKGGIGTYTLQMAKAIKNEGSQPEVFTASFTREISEEYEGILTHRVKVDSLQDFKFKVVEFFSKRHSIYPFDILECPEIGGEAELIKDKYPEIPLVVRLHTPGVLVTRLQNAYVPLLTKLRFVVGAFLRGRIDLGYWSKHDKNQCSDPDYLITSRADLITAPSNAMKEWAVRFWKIDKKRIAVIPNPYEPSRDLLSIKSKANNKTITFIGRLNVLKGAIVLASIIPEILKTFSDWKFYIIGNSEKSHIDGLSMLEWMKVKLSDHLSNIEFVDWVDNKDISDYLAKTDIVIIPSLFESFSYVCAEAMGAGKAIVGSNRGGISELLQNDAGILINPFNKRQIVKELIKLMSEPEKILMIGDRARERVLNDFSGVKIASVTKQSYITIAKKGQ